MEHRLRGEGCIYIYVCIINIDNEMRAAQTELQRLKGERSVCIYIYIYIYMCVCVCVCVCMYHRYR